MINEPGYSCVRATPNTRSADDAPGGSVTPAVTCTQLISRFDRNGERHIGLPLLRQVRSTIRDDMRSEGARGSMVWRLVRTSSGITVTAVWHARRDQMIDVARGIRGERLERRRVAAQAGIVNRRRLGRLCIQDASVQAGM